MVYTADFTTIKEAFTNTWALGTEWLIPLALAFVVMAFITRDTDKWKILFFPLIVLERIIGMPVHFILMSAGAILFVIEALSTQVVGNWVSAVKKWTGRSEVEMQERSLAKRDRILSAFKRAKEQESYLGSYAKKDKGVDPRKMKELIKLRKRLGLE